jgi:hypothetical protein
MIAVPGEAYGPAVSMNDHWAAAYLAVSEDLHRIVIEADEAELAT